MPHDVATRHRRTAMLVIVATVVATTSACTPITIPASPSPVGQGGGTAHHADQCQPGWVCGTCPDGSSWGYLNDPRYTGDPQISTLFFTNRRPCG